MGERFVIQIVGTGPKVYAIFDRKYGECVSYVADETEASRLCQRYNDDQRPAAEPKEDASE